MTQPWSPITLPTSDKDSYLATLTAFLAANPPGSLGGILASGGNPNPNFSSPEDSNSPASSEGSGTSGGAPLASVTQAARGGAGDKRKQSVGNADKGSIKDRRSSAGAANGTAGGGKDLDVGNTTSHTHPDLSDDEDGSDDKGKGGAGGKTSDKRRAQNRQAQRAFRERKEKHLKELEDRVFSLEQQATNQVTENQALKQLLERLQSENERLKVYESAFSFTYAKDVSTSTSMPTSVQFGGSPTAASANSNSSASPPSKPPSPPSDLTSYNLNFSNYNDYNNPFSPSAFMHNPESNSESPSSLTGSGLDNPLFFGTAAPSPTSTAGDSTSGSSANISTPPDLPADLFSAYRDTSSANQATFGDTLPDLDSLFGVINTGGIDENALASYLASSSPSPPAIGGGSAAFGLQQGYGGIQKKSSPSTNSATSPGQSPCTLFSASSEKFSFDEESLCSELQAKAVCREAAKAALQEAMKEDEKSLAAMYPMSG